MTESPSKNLIIIKYCLPLSAVSFIIFLCGFFIEGINILALSSSAVFTILISVIIYNYTIEIVNIQRDNEIIITKNESQEISKLHYSLHLINPSKKLKDKISLALEILSNNIREPIFVFYSCINQNIEYISASKNNSNSKIEIISQNDPLISDITNRIQNIIDYDSLKKSCQSSKPIIIPYNNNVEGQIIPIELYGNILGIIVEIGQNKLNNFENKYLQEFCKGLALILESQELINKLSIAKIQSSQPSKDTEVLTTNLYNSMFPKVIPTLPSWSIATYYKQSNNKADFLDILNVSTDKYLILYGKCSGHGIGAAVYVNKLKLIIRCFIENYQNPAKLLNKISKYLNLDLMPNLFVDVTALSFSSFDNTIDIAMAGNTIPIINRTRSGFAEIPELETGIPLGLFNQGTDPYKNQQINLMPGDGILLHTDGITDIPGKNLDRISNEDLKLILDKIPEQSANDMLNNIVKQIKGNNSNELPEEDHSIIYLKAE